MASNIFIKTIQIKGKIYLLYEFDGDTSRQYEIITALGTNIKKRFNKSPYRYAAQSPIESFKQLN
jgi:hypothetical protein